MSRLKIVGMIMGMGLAMAGCGDESSRSSEASIGGTVWKNSTLTAAPVASDDRSISALVEFEGENDIAWMIRVMKDDSGTELARALEAGPVELIFHGEELTSLDGVTIDGEPYAINRGLSVRDAILDPNHRTLCDWYHLEGNGFVSYKGQRIAVINQIGHDDGTQRYAQEAQSSCGYSVFGAPDCHVGEHCTFFQLDSVSVGGSIGSDTGGNASGEWVRHEGTCSSDWSNGVTNRCWCID